jgi:hypothetical protein
MKVIELTADMAEAFIAKQPVAVILYFALGDLLECELLARYKSTVNTFSPDDHLAFGSVDLTATENVAVFEQGIVVMTPTLIVYHFGEPVGEIVGCDAIVGKLRQNLVPSFYMHSQTWCRMLE